MRTQKIARSIRIAILLGILAYVTVEAYTHQVLGGVKAPSVHALCPFGALESLYSLLSTGSLIQKIYSGTVILLLVTVILAVLFRRSFCGLLCPFGALQELFGKVGRKLFKTRFVIPQRIDKPMRYLKYAILPLTIIMAWLYGTLWMAPYDPYSAYAHITAASDSIKENPLSLAGFILLAVTIIGSFVYDRFFCKYLCPVGALYGIIGKISPTRIERDDRQCTHCKICNKACPVNIEVDKSSRITSAECISCNECVLACPRKEVLSVKTTGRKIHPLIILAAVIVTFFGIILAAQLSGHYQVLPEALKKGDTVSISEIKGYYTIEESAAATGLSLEKLYEKLGIPRSVPQNTQMKEISNLVEGFSLDDAKSKAGEDEASDDQAKTSEKPEMGEDSSGATDISEVKGSMTIQEAADSIKMELVEFYRVFKIPENVPAKTRMKDIGSVSPGYDFRSIKESIR